MTILKFTPTRIILVFITYFSLLLHFSVSSANDDSTIAPDVVLKTLDDQSIKISDFRNKVIYLDFWATWCGPCRKSIPWMEQMHKQYADKGLKIIAVSIDFKKSLIERFLQRFEHGFTIAHDPEGISTKAYAVQVMPSSFIIDQHGKITISHKGFNEKDAAMLELEFKKLLGIK